LTKKTRFARPDVAARAWNCTTDALQKRGLTGKVKRIRDSTREGCYLYALPDDDDLLDGLSEPAYRHAPKRAPAILEEEEDDGSEEMESPEDILDASVIDADWNRVARPRVVRKPVVTMAAPIDEDADEDDVEMVVCFSDVHIPNHDPKALNVVMEFIADQQPDRIVLNGDLADMESASLHEGDPSDRKVREEIDEVNLFLDELQRIAPNATIHYNTGNHETRYERYVAARAPHLRGLTSLEEQLHLDERGITYLNYGDVYFVGKLGFTHGVYHNDFFTKNHLVKYGTSLVLGHTHRAQLYTMGFVNHEGPQVRGAFGLPCLSPVNDIPYIKGPTGWSQGFGVFMVEKKTGLYTPTIVLLNQHRFWWGRKRYG
jgi:predicted MPP superfamily phosphohydrolase